MGILPVKFLRNITAWKAVRLSIGLCPSVAGAGTVDATEVRFAPDAARAVEEQSRLRISQ